MQQHWLKNIHIRLANEQSLLHFSVIGVLAGGWCALVVLLFRFLVEWPGSLWLPGGNGENFEQLPRWMHFFLPLAGAIVIGLVFQRMKTADTRVGIVHVISRLHGHHGHLPLKNALVQLLGGSFALLTGQSGGREGPSIHLGAATNSLLGQYFMFPNNSIRVLVGCGTAGAIAAAFNTPIAGVIFAMEVVMMEYTIIGFTPIILAAITATAITQLIYGNESILQIPAVTMSSLWELPYIILLGLVVGLAAGLFNRVLKIGLSQNHRSFLTRATLAGLATGLCALAAPQIMGIGYDTLNDAFSGQLAVSLLLVIVIAKLLATALSVGLGLPIGLVGPTLVIGACLGDAMGIFGASILPDYASNRNFYVMLGMGAMMGAVLNAPLAALMALLELTQNTGIIFPGMLAITIANLTNTELCRQHSAHQTILHFLKQQLRTDPLSLSLQRTSVASLMDRNIHFCKQQIDQQQTEELLTLKCNWLIVEKNNGELSLLDARKVQRELAKVIINPVEKTLDLLALTDSHIAMAELHMQATLREALDLLDERNADAIYISGFVAASPYPDSGILTRADIHRYTNTPQ